MKLRFGLKNLSFSILSISILGLLALTAGSDVTVEEISGPGITPKTLPRKYDVVKVGGASLGRFEGIPIKNLSLMSLKNGKLSPVPFQVDERGRDGHYVMTHGKIAREDEDGGKLDANDEMLFLVADSGDRLPEAQRLKDGGRIEIELTDPRNSRELAWAYLTNHGAAAPRSSTDYIKYDPKTEQIITENAIVGYRKGFMFYNDLIYPKSVGGSGTDFLDRIKLRIRIDFFGGRVALIRNEEIVTAEVQGWIDGPVRVVQMTRNKLKIMDMMPTVSFDGMSEYYPHMMSTPIIVSFPFDLTRVSKLLGIKTFKAEILADLPGMMGGKAYSNLDLSGDFTYTGRTPPEVMDKLLKKGIIWGFATKKGVGTWFPRLIFPDPVYQYNLLYMTDDATRENPPDDVPGELGSGLVLDLLSFPPEIVKFIAEGTFELRFETYYAPSGLDGKSAQEWLDIQDYPLFVDTLGGESPADSASNKPAAVGPPWKGGRDGTITDTRGRKVALTGMAYFLGSVDVSPRMYFQGERMSDQTFHNINISKINSLTNRYVEYEPITKTKMAMFTKLALTDGNTLDLLGCKMCGWAGGDENGRVFYMPNSQVKNVEFKSK